MKHFSTLQSQQAFFDKHNIVEENLSYLGKGCYGTAYSVDDDRVLKKTTSPSEFEIAQKIMDNPRSNLVKIFAIEKIGFEYYILQEKLEQDQDIEDLFQRVTELLETQGLPITYLSSFMEDDYVEEYGEIPGDVQEFMNELLAVVHDATYIVGDAADISPDNLGRDKKGVLKAFDVDDKQQCRRRE